MPFDLHIKNIGKLADAKLRIGRFTVLAGPNNTGKSFVSKILYSLFDAMNANPAEVQMHRLTAPVRENLHYLQMRQSRIAMRHEASEELSKNSTLASLSNEIRMMEDLIVRCSLDDFDELDRIISDLAGKVKYLLAGFPASLQDLLSIQEDIFPHGFRDSSILEELRESVEELQNALADTNAKTFVLSGIVRRVRENLFQNFQVSNLASLRSIENRSPEVSIDGIGDFTFLNGDIDSRIKQTGLRQLRQYSKVIYLESPAYWKLKSPLENIRISPRYRYTRRERLTGIPGYFYDLAGELRGEYIGEMDFPELYENLTGANVLDGKLVISETGEILFHENKRSFQLSLTATGVINLGILALLIERKILDKESFVFIDEPEAHLHPAWQVVMAEALFELAKGGAHVVVATHSADVLKWLEVHIKKHPDDENLVALNQFPAGAAGGEEQSFADKMAAIKQGLTKPFADLYMEGL